VSPGLLVIITGPSHSGKSTLARLLLERANEPTAWLAMDDFVTRLNLGAGDQWEDGLPVAYDAVIATAAVLLDRDFVVLLETTFTYVPSDLREPRFHDDQLRRFLARSEATALVHLRTPLEVLRERRSLSGRFTDAVVAGTSSLHDGRVIESASHTVSVDTSRTGAVETADRVAGVLGQIRAKHRAANSHSRG